MEPVFLKNTTLHERQMRYYNGHECPYCGKPCNFVDSKEVYRESHGMIYICRPCQAWVGVHYKDSDQSYGFVAVKSLRNLRHEAHKWFDGLWQKKQEQGTKRKQAQSLARQWMAGFLKIAIEEAHIGMCTEEQCLKIIEMCKPFYPTQDEKAQIAEQRRIKVEMIKFFADSLDFTIKEFTLNGLHKIEMKKKDKEPFHYDVIKNQGYFGNKITWAPIEDLQETINTHFS